MSPSFLVGLHCHAGWRLGRMIRIGRVANRAGHARGAAAAGVLAIPGFVGMILANPKRITARGTGDRH